MCHRAVAEQEWALLANRLPRSATWWSDGSTLTSLLGVWPVIADWILAETEFKSRVLLPQSVLIATRRTG